MDTKLTLRLDGDIIQSAKEYARAKQTSLSRLVARYLKSLTQSSKAAVVLSPLVTELTGTLPASLSQEEFRQAYGKKLLGKYR